MRFARTQITSARRGNRRSPSRDLALRRISRARPNPTVLRRRAAPDRLEVRGRGSGGLGRCYYRPSRTRPTCSRSSVSAARDLSSRLGRRDRRRSSHGGRLVKHDGAGRLAERRQCRALPMAPGLLERCHGWSLAPSGRNGHGRIDRACGRGGGGRRDMQAKHRGRGRGAAGASPAWARCRSSGDGRVKRRHALHCLWDWRRGADVLGVRGRFGKIDCVVCADLRATRRRRS